MTITEEEQDDMVGLPYSNLTVKEDPNWKKVMFYGMLIVLFLVILMLSTSCKKKTTVPQEPQPEPQPTVLVGTQSGVWIYCGGDSVVGNLTLTATCLGCWDNFAMCMLDRYKLDQNIGYSSNNEIGFQTSSQPAKADTIQFSKTPHWYKFYRKK